MLDYSNTLKLLEKPKPKEVFITLSLAQTMPGIYQMIQEQFEPHTHDQYTDLIRWIAEKVTHVVSMNVDIQGGVDGRRLSPSQQAYITSLTEQYANNLKRILVQNLPNSEALFCYVFSIEGDFCLIHGSSTEYY